MARRFGPIPGVHPGTIFESRQALARAGIHLPLQAGISGGAREGADSIVLNGGYKTDEDHGDLIVYTGHGGRDSSTGKQVKDQVFDVGNAGLALSCDEGLPVRVTRGPGAGEHGPSSGYRYDGIYFVEQWWEGTDPDSGVRIFLYRLRRDPEGGREKSDGGPPGGPTEERYSTVQRLVRNTAVTEWVKKAHRHRCQVCGIELVTPGGNYAEGAHIRPRGRPHSGPDEASNVLCLCPNHHVLFDRGAIYVNADLEIVERASGEIRGKLRIVKGHDPSLTQLAYHRALFDRGKR